MILMQAPGADMSFGAAPSGASYVSDQFSLIQITNDSVADQNFLQGAGCFTLSPFGGWGTFSFMLLSDLYAADTAGGLVLPGITGFPSHTTCAVQNDGTNTGMWYKTGSGSGAGNWTQTLATLNPSASALLASSSAMAAAISATQAQAAAAFQNALWSSVTAGGTLPYEVSALAGGGGSGGTPGTYAGGVSGSGYPGFTWHVFVGSDGQAIPVIDTRGIGTSNTAPTLVMPTIAGLSGATTPTATVSSIANGRLFSAPSSDGTLSLAWENIGGTITAVTFGGTQISIPLAGFITNALNRVPQQLESLHAAEFDLVVIDSFGHFLSSVPPQQGIAVQAGATYVESLHLADGTNSVTIDGQGRMIQGPSAIDATARANITALSTRVGSVVNSAGVPMVPVISGYQLHNTRARLRQLEDLKAGTYNGVSGIAPTPTQLIIVLIGDSYSEDLTYWIGRLVQKMVAKYGDAGVGWISFAWYSGNTGTWTPSVQPSGKDVTARFHEAVTLVNVVGSWTCDYDDPTLNTPSPSCVSSSTLGDYLTWNFNAGHNACNLFYTGDGSGVVAVSWDDGTTYSSNIPLSAVGAGYVALPSVPSGATTARIKVVSGNVKVGGLDMQSANSGVRIHKLGTSGSRAQHWAQVTPATWAAQIAALMTDPTSGLVGVMLGANDQGSARTGSQFQADMTTIRANLRTMLPYADLLFQAQPENARTTNVYPMTTYRAAMAAMVLAAGDAAMLDHQYYWGPPDNNAIFYYNATRKWLETTQMLHPAGDGQYAMTDAVWRLLTAQV